MLLKVLLKCKLSHICIKLGKANKNNNLIRLVRCVTFSQILHFGYKSIHEVF